VRVRCFVACACLPGGAVPACAGTGPALCFKVKHTRQQNCQNLYE
jgi:hypothetical protein